MHPPKPNNFSKRAAGGGSLLETSPSMRENGASNGWQGASLSRSSSAAGLAEQLGDTDVLYLKNVVLKFLDACTAGKTEQVQSLPQIQEVAFVAAYSHHVPETLL